MVSPGTLTVLSTALAQRPTPIESLSRDDSNSSNSSVLQNIIVLEDNSYIENSLEPSTNSNLSIEENKTVINSKIYNTQSLLGIPTVMPPGTTISSGTVEGLQENLKLPNNKCQMNKSDKIEEELIETVSFSTNINTYHEIQTDSDIFQTSNKTATYKQLSILNFTKSDSSSRATKNTSKKIFCTDELIPFPTYDELNDADDQVISVNNTITNKCNKITSYFMKYNVRNPPKPVTTCPNSTNKDPESESQNSTSTKREIHDLQEIQAVLESLIIKTIDKTKDMALMRRLTDSTKKKNIRKPHIPVQLVSPRKSTFHLLNKNVSNREEISPPCNSTRLGIEAKGKGILHT